VCGIVGIVSGVPVSTAILAAMSATMRHRGPDDSGVWLSEDRKVGLGHRRLSILDLSPAGRNPMPWDGGRLQITYNGEVYNFQDLRSELESFGYRFRSNSDTEVILAAYDRWGIDCLGRLIGMFAFGLWDAGQNQLILARDRLGQKPLYYSQYNGQLVFASELKALMAHPELPRDIASDAVSMYLKYWYVPAPLTIFRHACKLPPAHYAVYKDGNLRIESYWDPVEIASKPRTRMADEEATQRLETLLKDSVRRQMVADVPLGAFLSGGIDSSLVVALMQEQTSQQIKTFTIRFEDPEFNEADHAAAVASHLGTEHYEETCSTAQMLEIVSRLPDYFDEPFADASAIPTYLVSRVTRQRVTVALSGDGGDELFFGYHRYHNHAKRLAEISPENDPVDELQQYAHWHVSWPDAEIKALLGRVAVKSPAHESMQRKLQLFPALERPPILDLVTYLPEQILTKVDRASMAASLEARAPFLDHRVVEFSLGLPLELKWRNREGKWLLRRLLYKRAPRQLVDRPKMGFSVPLAEWFRGGLREQISNDFAGTLLEELEIDPRPVRLLWRDLIAGKSDSVDLIWTLFALTSWARRWR
jgi:asparagine synthase (glutamine-hydrolysing)